MNETTKYLKAIESQIKKQTALAIQSTTINLFLSFCIILLTVVFIGITVLQPGSNLGGLILVVVIALILAAFLAKLYMIPNRSNRRRTPFLQSYLFLNIILPVIIGVLSGILSVIAYSYLQGITYHPILLFTTAQVTWLNQSQGNTSQHFVEVNFQNNGNANLAYLTFNISAVNGSYFMPAPLNLSFFGTATITQERRGGYGQNYVISITNLEPRQNGFISFTIINFTPKSPYTYIRVSGINTTPTITPEFQNYTQIGDNMYKIT